jgi:phosphoenolpyruvate carboxykinase (ATP)
MTTSLATVDTSSVLRDPSVETLREIALSSGQCRQTCDGALVLLTGKHTGRAVSDRYIVETAATARSVAWGKVNQPLSLAHFRVLQAHLRAHLAGSHTFELSLHAGGGAGVPVHVTTTSAAHALFCRYLLQQARVQPRGRSTEPLYVLHAPECRAVPAIHGTKSGTFIVLDLDSRTVLIGGTAYAGELKKAVFSCLNYELPERGILPMHAAVNVGHDGDSAVFFGLSGTGKTTLSADPARYLVGDDEHGWSAAGLFNLEGGCYAKTIGLRQEFEPDIWAAVHAPTALLENVVMDERGEVAWHDAAITENTRGAYPLSSLEHAWRGQLAAPPKNVIFLSADAFGVLPPVARLSVDQAAYFFLSGYTAKVAGTEAGVLRPEPTFSTCFGAPFMPRHPTIYAELLRQRLLTSGASVWLVNTGWVGGPYGEGQRMPIAETRAIITAILEGHVAQNSISRASRFHLDVPLGIAGVDARRLDPRASWPDPTRYDAQEAMLAEKFAANFEQYAPFVSSEVLRLQPK